MYTYEWDSSTGGYVLTPMPLTFSKEPRPVYYKELDILGFDKYWIYDKNDSFPYMWAEANNYFYRGRLVAKTKGGSVYNAPEIEIVEAPEPEGYPLRYVDIPAMINKNKDIMEQLEQETIKKIYNTYISYKKKVDVFYVAFSGGKDSIVALDLVQRALPHNEFKVLFGDTRMEFPDTYSVVEEIKRMCSELKIEFISAKSKMSPLETWSIFGPPGQTMRWCCSVHKTTPQVLALREYTNNPHFKGMAFTGIRGDESASRSEYDDVSEGEKIRGQFSCHPILEWNSAELFNYIYDKKLIMNEAYKKGNSRAGCLVCPMATYKNMFFKEVAYKERVGDCLSTTDFNNIILSTSSKPLSSKKQIKEFMETGGWKARRSGRELKIAKNKCSYTFEKGVFAISITEIKSDWKEWAKTLGKVEYPYPGTVEILFENQKYIGEYQEEENGLRFEFNIETNTKTDINFMSAFKIIMRKTAFCVMCQVCEANCPHGCIHMMDGKVTIDDKCIKCRKCHEVVYGCQLANSMRLPKGEGKVAGINRYGNMGIEYGWLDLYFKYKDDFWTSSDNNLGSKKIEYIDKFLLDSGLGKKEKKGNKYPSLTRFGEIISDIGIDTSLAWAFIAVNWSYSSQFGWWIKNIELNNTYSPEAIYAMLDDSVSETVREHIISAYKNTFISNEILGKDLGFGVCDYEEKRGRTWISVIRFPWANPDERVILYALYKFAEKCGNRKQFTLTELLDNSIERDGISPTQIFGLDREMMEKILNGLTFNYPELIEARFTLGLDSITLKSDVSSEELLNQMF
ncbi:phosphoadenosine phosphosulfate reductase [Lachnospiraceae bacterium G41]|nr:phosphoadenosine phosphosulfate reductase [Lachnospiraceae bacterium G41]